MGLLAGLMCFSWPLEHLFDAPSPPCGIWHTPPTDSRHSPKGELTLTLRGCFALKIQATMKTESAIQQKIQRGYLGPIKRCDSTKIDEVAPLQKGENFISVGGDFALPLNPFPFIPNQCSDKTLHTNPVHVSVKSLEKHMAVAMEAIRPDPELLAEQQKKDRFF